MSVHFAVAKRFVEKFGCMRLTVTEALVWLKANMKETDLFQQINKFLRSGSVVPDELTIQAIEAVTTTAQGHLRG